MIRHFIMNGTRDKGIVSKLMALQARVDAISEESRQISASISTIISSLSQSTESTKRSNLEVIDALPEPKRIKEEGNSSGKFILSEIYKLLNKCKYVHITSDIIIFLFISPCNT